MGNSDKEPGKKLIEAARFWAGDRGVAASLTIDQDYLEGMAAAGFPEEHIEAARAAARGAEPQFEVFAENWQSVTFFTAISTQWIAAAMGGFIGLNYASVEAALRIKGLPRQKWRKRFYDIQIMESAALDYFNEKRESEK